MQPRSLRQLGGLLGPKVARATSGARASFEVGPPVRVAVLGSCVSRDLFNSRFNPHYKDLFECVALSNQVSLISLMSSPLDIAPSLLDGLDDYGKREVAKEISRSFLQEVVRARPDYLLIDLFADVHFGCLEVDGRHLTRNRWKIMKSRYYAETDFTDLLPYTDAYFAVWEKAVDELLLFVRTHLPATQLVLHRARNVSKSLSADGSVRPLGRERDLSAMNSWWNRLDDALAARGVSRVLDLFTDDLTSFDAHPWGPFAVHYTLDYHAAALSRLTRIALSDATDRGRSAQDALTWRRPHRLAWRPVLRTP